MGKRNIQDDGEEGGEGGDGWLSHDRALIKRSDGWLQRVIGVELRLHLETNQRPGLKRRCPALDDKKTREDEAGWEPRGYRTIHAQVWSKRAHGDTRVPA